jgi:photosystem II stability/assembly factor-like uncharacterized protein
MKIKGYIIIKFSENSFVEDDFRLDAISLMKENFTDIQFINNYGWVISDKGLVLTTKDKGKNWQISKWGDFVFNDIYMLNERVGFIAADGGVILTTDDGGRYWKLIDTKDVTLNFKRLSFLGDMGIATASKGRIYITYDGGQTWNLKTIYESKRKNKLVDLNAVFFVNDKNIWIAGNDGVLLHSTDRGNSGNKSALENTVIMQYSLSMRWRAILQVKMGHLSTPLTEV